MEAALRAGMEVASGLDKKCCSVVGYLDLVLLELFDRLVLPEQGCCSLLPWDVCDLFHLLRLVDQMVGHVCWAKEQKAL